MICLECVNGLRRDMPGKTEVVCCLDSRLVMSVYKCNFFFRAVDDRPIVESVLPDFKVQEAIEAQKVILDDMKQYSNIVEVPRETSNYYLKRAVGLVKEGEKACKEICGEIEVPGSSVVERADEFIEQIEENSRKIIENDIKLAELKRGRGRPRKT